MEFEDFVLPFSGNLRSGNRWVKLAKFIPWDEFESAYSKSLGNSSLGPPAKSVRIALGALIIKERLGSTDEETVEQIRENPYLRVPRSRPVVQDKRRFSLARIMCKLALTSETAITVAFLVMNLERWLKSRLFYLLSVAQGSYLDLSGLITADLMGPKGISSNYRNMGKCICQV